MGGAKGEAKAEAEAKAQVVQDASDTRTNKF